MADTLEFSLLGHRCVATGLPAGLAAWLRQHWEFPHERRVSAPVTVRVEPGAPPGGSTAAAGTVTLPGVELRCQRAGRGWMLGNDDVGVLLDPDLRISFWAPRDRVRAVQAPLFLALAEAVRLTGLLPLHAAVACPPASTEATAFVAVSGTGKSTTLAAAVLRGWRPLAEDFAWLDPATLEVFGWDRGVHLRPDSLAGPVAALAGLPWQDAAGGKRFLPFDVLTGGGAPQVAPVARLASVASLSRDAGAAGGWEPLPVRDAVRVLWEAAGVPFTAEARRLAESAMPGLLERLSYRRLVLGHEPVRL